MTASRKNKRKPSASSATECSDTSTESILAELSAFRLAAEESAAAYTQIANGLNQQNLCIVSIAEAINEIKTGIHQPVEACVTDESADETSGNYSTFAEDVTAEYESHRLPEEEGVSSSDWNDIRQAFLEQHTDESEQLVVETGTDELEPTDAVDDENEELDRLLAQLPSTVEADSEDLEELHRAVIDRDRTISVLVRRLQKQNRSLQTMTPEQLGEIVDRVPEELAQCVEASLQAVDQQVRLGELELSLERARVSRQLSKLEETRTRLESNARHFGLTIAEDGTIEGDANLQNKQGTKGRRWLGVLGFGN